MRAASAWLHDSHSGILRSAGAAVPQAAQ